MERFISSLSTPPASSILISHPSGDVSRGDFLEWSREKSGILRNLAESSGSSWGLPVLIDDSLESCLVTLTCIFQEIPFIAIDSNAPAGRIERALRLIDNPQTVLAPSGSSDLRLPTGVFPVDVDDEPRHSTEVMEKAPATNPGLTILTSGSTGNPKGVHLPFDALQQQMEHLAENMANSGPPIRVSSLAPLHFIGGIKKLLRGLIGAEIHFISPHQFTIHGLVSELHRRKITHLSLPPQIARLIAQHRGAPLPLLENVVELRLGAEGIRFEMLQGLRKCLRDGVSVKHGLGSTEGSSGIRNVFTLGSIPESGQVPIGRPTRPENVHFEPQPELGDDIWEVYVSGPITSGYVGSEELNASRFSTSQNGQRWWHSGDLVSLNSEGMYIHRGRKDDLIKVRGMLASPSEATQILQSVDGVRAALVLPHRDKDNVRLHAHIEFDEGAELSVSDLRKELRKLLPDHLIPSSIMVHNQLPMNSRGKIDRSTLAAELDVLTGKDCSQR